MIQSKCAELFFLIGCVLVHVGESNFVDNSRSKNNKPFFMNRFDDIIGNGSSGNVDDRFIFTTKSLPSDSRRMPALSNGHLGFIVYSDSVYINALYNGRGGLSHRARIPNFGRLQLADCQTHNCKYTLNVKYGYFMVEMNVENQFIATHLIYAHRYYDRAMINQFYIQRTGSKDAISLKLKKYLGYNETSRSSRILSHDIKFTKNETIHLNNSEDFQLLCGHIMEKEGFTGEEPMRQEENVCVLWNHVPEELTLSATASSISYKFVMAVDIQEADVRQEMVDVFSITNDELLIKHIAEWKKFWNDFRIEIEGDDELLRAITSSMFNIVCNLPSEHTNLPQHPFFGLSPTGLARGGSDLSDYEGHNFWDTEIFMFPPIAIINHNWAKRLLYYRFIMLDSAKEIAKNNGFKGAQFPWESAAIGFETVQPSYEYIAKYQIHNTGDISFAMQQYFGLTNDLEWAEDEGCEMAEEIAKFWASRVSWNETSGFYDINHVMGPDEDHRNVSNNVYTNVVAASALKFGAMMRGLCGGNETDDESSKWLKIAEKIKIEYNETLDYHPEFEGYEFGGEVKQADTILIGYPLMHPMDNSTRRNDLNFYLNVTRKSGPAMTHSMFAINYLDIGDLSDANLMLERCYKPYINSPFNVWFEVIDDNVEQFASNFITGAGGFLQTIFNGYFGIRIHLDFLEIKKPFLVGKSTSMKICGIKYFNSTIEIKVGKVSTDLKFMKLGDELDLFIDDDTGMSVEENFAYNVAGFTSLKIMKSSRDYS